MLNNQRNRFIFSPSCFITKKFHKFDTIIRNLSPTPKGLPVQIYAFCNETRWREYESIQSLIIEHLIATTRDFDLKIFQVESDKKKR